MNRYSVDIVERNVRRRVEVEAANFMRAVDLVIERADLSVLVLSVYGTGGSATQYYDQELGVYRWSIATFKDSYYCSSDDVGF